MSYKISSHTRREYFLQIWLKRFVDLRVDNGWIRATAICVSFVFVATIVRIMIGNFAGVTLSFATYFPAVLLSALLGGWIAGLLSIPLTIAVVWWAIEAPVYAFGPLTRTLAANFTLFALSGFLIVWLAASFRALLLSYDKIEDERKLLIGELEHRGKNVVAVVVALIRQTVTEKPLAETLVNRVLAVTSMQDIFEQTPPLTMIELLQEVTFVAHGRTQLSGQNVRLTEGATRTMRLIFHELLTNAIKHGSLSDEKGRVTVEWKIEGDYLNIEWCELDGPIVSAPKKFNFGSRLITQMLKRLKAEFDPRFPETGYCYIMRLPLSETEN